jgi:cytochrome c oxidase subunit II
MSPMRRACLTAVVGAGVLLLSACGSDDPQDVFAPKGEYADKINRLQVPVFIIAGIVGLIVAVLLTMAIVTGIRRRKADDDEPVQLEGNFKLEIAWTIAPAVLLAAISVATVGTLVQLDDAGANSLDDIEITVAGQQWWWAFEYDLDPDADDGPEIITANDLVMPAGPAVTLNVESRDVIHSFWIPALNGTRDAVPGRVHSLILQADEPGVYLGQCKEYCGLSHANMHARAVALTESEFATWIDQQQGDQPMLAEGDRGYEGQQNFLGRCTSCHQIDGLEVNDEPLDVTGNAAVVSGYAPDLTHLMTRGVFAGGMFDLWITDEEGRSIVNRPRLEAWLRDPPAEKPMYTDPPEGELPRGMPDLDLTEAEIDQLVEYLETLGDEPPIQTAGVSD